MSLGLNELAWHQTGDNYLNQCWPRCPMPYHHDVIRQQWVNTLRSQQNDQHFALENTFSLKIHCILIKISQKVCSNWQTVIVGSNNGLLPKTQKPIIWANDEKDHWYHMASLGHNELTLNVFKNHINICWHSREAKWWPSSLMPIWVTRPQWPVINP